MPPPSPANQPGPVSAAPDPGPPSAAERAYLARGLDQPGGKLPLFDTQGQAYPPGLIRACIRKGWATPWFANPMKPDWLVCRLTDAGRAVAGGD
ncbi:MAG: hypothetical protein U5L06_09575 [Rhodovibrio sp.]|nr:hypothetical protein [Rhodovibrio sp.]